MTWRAAAAPIIARVIREVGNDDPAALRRALREAYPWGQRSLWPYKVWRDEIRRQLTGAGFIPREARPCPEGQMDLFTKEESA